MSDANVDPDKLAERIAKETSLQCGYADMDEEIVYQLCNDIASTFLAPLLARNAAMEAVLRECRPIVQEAVNEDEREYNLRPLDEACRQNLEESSALLHGIDELTAKGAGQ